MKTLSPFHRLACVIALSLIASGCAGSERRSADADRNLSHDAKHDAHTGTIVGSIHHPAHLIPSMRICAIGSGEKPPRVCVETRRDQATYRIDGLAPGDYTVIAAGGGRYGIAGHVQQVQCIRAPCPEMPATVTVAAGATVSGIHINGFYQQRDDFPAMPAE